MGRIMAFDYGNKRIGIAVTDTLQIIASPLDTIHPKDIFAFIDKYLVNEQVEAFVLGMPVHLDGNPTDSTSHVVGFSRQLYKKYPNIPIHLVDERFTSRMALQSMIASGVSKKDRATKGNIDKVSATIILQSYMEQKSNGF